VGCLIIHHVVDNVYYLYLFVNTDKESYYSGYISKFDIPLIIKGGFIKLFHSPVLGNNKGVYETIPKDKLFLQKCLLASSKHQSDHKSIKELACNITSTSYNDYSKLLAIHDWVADNIWYDYDALVSGKYTELDCSALGVLKSKRTVCQGYTDLSIALLRAVNIPSFGMECYALGVFETMENWNKANLYTCSLNHIITMSFIDNRWIVCDITWDSDNMISGGKQTQRTGIGTSRKYFDTTVPFISNTHRFALTNISNIKIKKK